MGPFLTNSYVIKLSLGKGARLNSPQQLCVPYELLSRTLEVDWFFWTGPIVNL